MAVVLVTAIGSFAGDIAVENLKRRGHRVVGCDIYPGDWIADSRNVDFFAQSPLPTEEERYCAFLGDLCNAHGIQYVIPLTDPEVDVLSENKARFNAEGICVCTSDFDVVRLCRDKYALPTFLKQVGIAGAIETSLLGDAARGDALGYPLVAKPRKGRSSQGCFRIADRLDLDYVRAKHGHANEYVLQPCLAGSVVTVDVLRCPATGQVICVSRRELLRTVSGAGTTVEIFPAEDLHRICRAMAAALEVIGCVNCEFIECAEGDFHLLEINPRFSAGVEFSYMAGYDFVSGHLDCFAGNPVPAAGVIRQLTIARKYEEYVMREKRDA